MFRFLSVVLVSVLLSGCMGFGIKGEGEKVEDKRFVGDFNGIRSKVSADIIIRQSADKELRIVAQKNILEILTTEVDGDVLKIEFKQNVSNHKGITIYISNPEYKEIAVMGSGNMSSKGKIKAKDMEISVAGSGDIDLHVQCSELKAKIAGSGDIKLEGMVDQFDLSIAGSGDLEALNMEAINCEVSIAGSGSAEVFASGTLSASIAGSGDIIYKGDPKVESKIKGSGSISKAN